MKLECKICVAQWSIRSRGDYDFGCPNGCDSQRASNAPLTDAEAVQLALNLYGVGGRKRSRSLVESVPS